MRGSSINSALTRSSPSYAHSIVSIVVADDIMRRMRARCETWRAL